MPLGTRPNKVDYEIMAYAGPKHHYYKNQELLIHSWHIGEHSMSMDRDIWLERMAKGECSYFEIYDMNTGRKLTYTINVVEAFR